MAIRVSFLVSRVVSSPIRTIDSSDDSHGPCHYRTVSIILGRDLFNHSHKKPTEFSTLELAVVEVHHVRDDVVQEGAVVAFKKKSVGV